MKKSDDNFKTLLCSLQPTFDLPTVFNDFLTCSICALSPNPLTGKSHYEGEYLQVMEKYKDSPLRFNFPKAFGALVNEMTDRMEDSNGNDVLGEFFETQLKEKSNNGIFFTPYPICQFMAKSCIDQSEKKEGLRILDPACGSGRMLLASHREAGDGHYYYGIDIDERCVKMATINLMLMGIFKSEIMCANALMPDDFRFSYRISLLPFGIFKITEKEKSPLWLLMQNALKANKQKSAPNPPHWDDSAKGTFGDQLTIF